ncbi:hypothetical protein KSP40_PGU015371 [Platanthera guangdongensis]|uniref:RNase H type-1 domain-containing protein n=1 Tax=Platanthera guangdongensis TaxID=2320717 RepID=A0ABR2LCR8_9ASPA
MENNLAGLGCTLRDFSGCLIAAKGIVHRRRSVCVTEFMAAIAGLRLATRHNWRTRGLIIEGDLVVTINRISCIIAGWSSGQHESLTARLMKDFPRVEHHEGLPNSGFIPCR